MIYFISLQWVAVAIGIAYLTLHLFGILAPAKFIVFAKNFPRSKVAGIVLGIGAGIWTSLLVGFMDLGEFSTYRETFVFICIASTILTVIFVQAFLAVRALSILLLLGVGVILDAAFVQDTPWRLVMTSLAYAWAIAGMFFVSSPYLFRDLMDRSLTSESRCRQLCVPGAVLGALMIALGIFVY